MTRKNSKISVSPKPSDEDREAFIEEVYRKYFKRLFAYARVIVDSQSLAKDVVSDFFFALWKNKTNLLEIKDLEVYLFVSVRNQSVRALKKAANLYKSEQMDIKVETIDYINPEELLLEKELLTALEEIISNLPDQCQLIFRLYREQGMKNSQIAQELGISTVTVKSQMRRAQAKLRSGILRYYQDGEKTHCPEMKLIGQYLVLSCVLNYDFIN